MIITAPDVAVHSRGCIEAGEEAVLQSWCRGYTQDTILDMLFLETVACILYCRENQFVLLVIPSGRGRELFPSL